MSTARPGLTQTELLALRNKQIHARFVDLYQKRQRTYDDALRIMEKQFFLTTRSLRRILQQPLPAS